MKLNGGWSYTVVCGNLNYDFMVKMCATISSAIRVIRTDYDNLNQSTYSQLLASLPFWELFYGEKILITQEDSCIFTRNIREFMHWDYIGAPWPATQNDTPTCVGNGGFSLRTRQCMMDVIRSVPIDQSSMESDTRQYMKNTHMTIMPEDVYFAYNMSINHIGNVADWESARQFSTESICNSISVGGHNFWLNDPNWKHRVTTQTAGQLRAHCDETILEHRGGWKSVMHHLEREDLFNPNASIDFFDMIEKPFIWKQHGHGQLKEQRKWGGVVHCTPSTPSYLHIVNISQLFVPNSYFIQALPYCLFIVVLSQYVADYFNSQFELLQLMHPPPVHVLFHPVETDDIIPFSFHSFLNNPNKQLIQLGQQLRKMSSIYKISVPSAPVSISKMWLTGTQNFNKCIQLLKLEKTHDLEMLDMASVKMTYLTSFCEFDLLLANNIVFVDLFDASACNAILECIVRNTPIIINRLPAVVEYLGDSYPLYFKSLDEVPTILEDTDRLLKAHLYLTRMDKSQLSIDYFSRQLFTIISHTCMP
jgi:hypothetical protein